MKNRIDPPTEHGHVYLPAEIAKWYRLSVSIIFHGVEGIERSLRSTYSTEVALVPARLYLSM
jgi:hypothetical protein